MYFVGNYYYLYVFLWKMNYIYNLDGSHFSVQDEAASAIDYNFRFSTFLGANNYGRHSQKA